MGFNKSFSCDVNRTINGFSHVTSYMNVSLFTMDFQVQAFDFKNPTSGAFDSSKPREECISALFSLTR